MLLSPKASATLKKTSPSAEAWTRTMCSQFAHCENADAGVVTKLLTPCTGPVSPAPQEVGRSIAKKKTSQASDR
eukprot:2751499-Amphidinium_carterae.1